MLFLLPLLWVRSALIKKSLKSRGIIVSGRNWRGAEVERIILDEFKAYLAYQGLHNPGAIKQLIDNVRDEAAADSRPSLRMWTVLAISFAIVVAFPKFPCHHLRVHLL